MAISFKQTKGKAQSNKVETFEFKDGENSFRMFGGVIPRYVYWVKGKNNKDIPIECLAFSRDKEKFDNLETDHVTKAFPELRPSWSYVVNVIDLRDGKPKACNLKRKLFESIVSAAEDLGDPTDPDEGWDVVCKRVKTGPMAFNVEYQLQVLRCKKRALSDVEREAIGKEKSIDEKYPRPTQEEVLALLEKISSHDDESDESNQAEKEAVNELQQ